MDTAWITQGLLQYNKSGKREARAAPVPELDNCLWCDIDVSSECRQCPKPPNSLSTYSIAVRGICRSIFSSFYCPLTVSSFVDVCDSTTSGLIITTVPYFTTVAVGVQHHRPGIAVADPRTDPAKAFRATFTLTLWGNIKSSSPPSPNDYNGIERENLFCYLDHNLCESSPALA